MKIFIYVLVGFFTWTLLISSSSRSEDKDLKSKYNNSGEDYEQYVLDIYTKSNLNDKLDFTVFNRAMIGYNSFNLVNKKILTLIDFSKPSTEERLFRIDVENRKLPFQTFVAHGKNSGVNIATQFSNRSGSLKSSLFLSLQKPITGNIVLH